jgi:hypothetical protein
MKSVASNPILSFVLMYGWIGILLIDWFVPSSVLGIEAYTFYAYTLPLLAIWLILCVAGLKILKGKAKIPSAVGSIIWPFYMLFALLPVLAYR